ncbi:hypothetical protein E4U41_005506 [Claviceps citrina]|nr:hypothetical protein E4U41_005506 [Claviceps citrina]
MASMKRFAVLALLSIQTAAAALTSPLPGYGVHTFEWDIEVSPGHTQSFSGTVEQVQSQVRKLNPRWEPGLAGGENASFIDRRDDVTGELIFWREVNCGKGQDWGGVLVESGSAIEKGIKHLREVSKWSGGPKAGPGPGLCGRSPNEKSLASFLNIADGAYQIIKKCLEGDDEKRAKGQIFTDADWNVIVRKDTQDC